MPRYNVYFKSENASPWDSNRSCYTVDASSEADAISKWERTSYVTNGSCRNKVVGVEKIAQQSITTMLFRCISLNYNEMHPYISS